MNIFAAGFIIGFVFGACAYAIFTQKGWEMEDHDEE